MDQAVDPSSVLSRLWQWLITSSLVRQAVRIHSLVLRDPEVW